MLLLILLFAVVRACVNDYDCDMVNPCHYCNNGVCTNNVEQAITLRGIIAIGETYHICQCSETTQCNIILTSNSIAPAACNPSFCQGLINSSCGNQCIQCGPTDTDCRVTNQCSGIKNCNKYGCCVDCFTDADCPASYICNASYICEDIGTRPSSTIFETTSNVPTYTDQLSSSNTVTDIVVSTSNVLTSTNQLSDIASSVAGTIIYITQDNTPLYLIAGVGLLIAFTHIGRFVRRRIYFVILD